MKKILCVLLIMACLTVFLGIGDKNNFIISVNQLYEPLFHVGSVCTDIFSIFDDVIYPDGNTLYDAEFIRVYRKYFNGDVDGSNYYIDLAWYQFRDYGYAPKTVILYSNYDSPLFISRFRLGDPIKYFWQNLIITQDRTVVFHSNNLLSGEYYECDYDFYVQNIKFNSDFEF